MKTQKRSKAPVSEKGVSRSQLIRDFVAGNPGLSAAAIAEQLAAAGTPVSVGLVYQVLHLGKKKSVTRKAKPVSLKAKPVSMKASRTAGAKLQGPALQSAEVYSKMLDFVESVGGLKQASALLQKLQS